MSLSLHCWGVISSLTKSCSTLGLPTKISVYLQNHRVSLSVRHKKNFLTTLALLEVKVGVSVTFHNFIRLCMDNLLDFTINQVVK